MDSNEIGRDSKWELNMYLLILGMPYLNDHNGDVQYEIFFLIASTYLHDIGMLGELDSSKDNIKNIREKHHLKSEEFINDNFGMLGIEDPHQAYIIGRICRGHREEDLSNIDVYPFVHV